MTFPDQTLLGRLLRLATTLSRAGVWVGGILTLASVFLITYDVLIRKFFGVSAGGADELSSYAFAISISWALAFTVLERANVRVDVIYQYFPVRISALLDWIALVGLGVFSAHLTWYAYDVVFASWEQEATANTLLATPLWIPQSLWLLGLGWFSLVLALMLIRASVALVTGDIETVKALCGVKSAKEEGEEEAIAGARMVEEAQK